MFLVNFLLVSKKVLFEICKCCGSFFSKQVLKKREETQTNVKPFHYKNSSRNRWRTKRKNWENKFVHSGIRHEVNFTHLFIFSLNPSIRISLLNNWVWKKSQVPSQQNQPTTTAPNWRRNPRWWTSQANKRTQFQNNETHSSESEKRIKYFESFVIFSGKFSVGF